MSERNAIYYIFSVVRILLYPVALLYGGIVWLRNRLYDAGFFSAIEFSVPVISVGNLSVGGTGKTPHIEYLIRLLEYQYKVATMSRGYKRRTQGFLLADEQTNALRIGDEPMQYHMKFPELVVSVAEERMTGIPHLLQKRPEVEVILLDDAYQHRSVKPGLNILITDFSRPFYKDFILPYGQLREGRAAAKRADIIVVSKCPQTLLSAEADAIRKQISPAGYQQVFFSGIMYDHPYDFFTGYQETITGNNVILVCCIARPGPLEAHVRSLAGAVHVLAYPDHHYFLKKDMEEIEAAYRNWEVTDKIIVTTEKDATRLHLQKERLQNLGVRLLVLPIKVKILLGQEELFNKAVLDYMDTAHAAGLETALPLPE